MISSLMMRSKQVTFWVMPLMLLSLSGCEYALFDTAGPVGEAIAGSMSYTFWLMMLVVIPTVFLSVWIPYRYRASNQDATYKPDWSHSTLIESIVWGIPCVIVFFLAIETYKTSHALDPHKPLVSPIDPQIEPLKIQVVALDWKWLFIYPEEGVASINELSIPVNRPVQFLLTSDGAINSFFIPRLGSQLYAMSGMQSKLNLMANREGTFKGISANYSGFGFSGMRFNVLAREEAGYTAWINSIKKSGKALDDTTYNALTKKSRDNRVEYFVNVNPLRFKDIIEKNVGINLGTGKPLKDLHSHDGHADDSHHHAAQDDEVASNDASTADENGIVTRETVKKDEMSALAHAARSAAEIITTEP